MRGAIQPLVTHKRGACMGLFIPLLHIRRVHAWGYLTTCYTEKVRMYGAIQPLVTLKRGVCMGLFNLLLHLRGMYVWSYSTPCYT
jgi:hypothetical protein